jgi:hypothetical protein
MLDRRLVYSRFRPGHVLRDEGSLLTSTTFARGYELLLVGCSGGELRAHDAYSGEAVDEVADAHSGPVVMLQVGGRGWGGSEAGRLGGWGGLGVWSPPRAAQGRVQPAGRCVNAVAHPRPPRPRPQTHELPGAPADELLLLSSSRHEAKLWRGADLATSSAHEFPGLTRARFNPAGTQVRPRRLMPVCSWARRPPRAEQRHSEPPDSVNSPDPNPVPPPTQPPSPRAQIVGVSSLPPRRALIYDAATGAALAELDDAALARGAGQGGADRGRGAAAACFSPTGELLLWGTTLWDPRVPVAVHTFDQLSEHQVGGPGAREAREVLGRPGASPSANQAPAQQRLGTAAPLPPAAGAPRPPGPPPPTPPHPHTAAPQAAGSAFHPGGLELILNSEVWDLRTYKLMRSVPCLDATSITFNSGARGRRALWARGARGGGACCWDCCCCCSGPRPAPLPNPPLGPATLPRACAHPCLPAHPSLHPNPHPPQAAMSSSRACAAPATTPSPRCCTPAAAATRSRPRSAP